MINFDTLPMAIVLNYKDGETVVKGCEITLKAKM